MEPITNEIGIRPGETMSHRNQILEYKRMIAKAEEAGIPRDFVKQIQKDSIAELLTQEDQYSAEKAEELLDQLFNAAQNWAFKGSFIVIEGEDENDRNKVARACLFRGIVAHSREPDRLGLSISMGELAGMLLSTPLMRTEYSEHLKEVPCVLISDLDPNEKLSKSDYTDAVPVFDGILSGRKSAGRPTIITVDGKITNDGTIRGRYGKRLSDVLHHKHEPEEGYWRVEI